MLGFAETLATFGASGEGLGLVGKLGMASERGGIEEKQPKGIVQAEDERGATGTGHQMGLLTVVQTRGLAAQKMDPRYQEKG